MHRRIPEQNVVEGILTQGSKQQANQIFSSNLIPFLLLLSKKPYFIVCMDLDTGEWQRSNFELPNELTFARLVSDGDKKLSLISGNGSNGISRSMKLWELDENSKIWVVVENLAVIYLAYENLVEALFV
ncbi:hypothetical protein RND71_027712 [Anisodus tanguticus]|uniref:Uncharacterized protein n=1 Tax=Anisodus tanguticus TaxID=243964 RepID=A0AAE1V8E4_9SOLA|nr:hypothetical protein RND71_027712 [Anisodus tanguticus]